MSMNEKNDVQVIINGKQYTLCGYESSDYLQHIANHINEKYAEFKKQDAYNRLDMDMKNVLMAINLSDDYFKAQKLAEETKQQQEELEQEMFRMKHDIVKHDDEKKDLESRLKKANDKIADLEKQNIRYETELKQKSQDHAKKEQELSSKKDEQTKREQELSARQADLDKKEQELAKKEQELAVQKENLYKKNQEIDKKNRELQQRVAAMQMSRTMSMQQTGNAAEAGAPKITASTGQAAAGAKPVNQAAAGRSSTGNTVEAGKTDSGSMQQRQTEPLMSGIQPVKPSSDQEKPAIAAFEFEEEPVKSENMEPGQPGGKGRKNSGSKRSQSRRK